MIIPQRPKCAPSAVDYVRTEQGTGEHVFRLELAVPGADKALPLMLVVREGVVEHVQRAAPATIELAAMREISV